MVNPDGTSSVSTNKSAQTRFANDQQAAARGSMPLNQAAQLSLRNKTSKSTPGGPPAAPSLQVKQQPVVNSLAQPQINTLNETLPPVDPNQLRENMVNDLVSKVRQEQFINSPQVKDAMTSIRLRNLFNATNPEAMPDNRDLMGRIKARLGGNDPS